MKDFNEWFESHNIRSEDANETFVIRIYIIHQQYGLDPLWPY